jgi:hypothetical protein
MSSPRPRRVARDVVTLVGPTEFVRVVDITEIVK